MFRPAAFALCGLLMPTLAFAADSLDSHTHGAATLQAAIEGQKFEVMLSSPAFNIVGFEHQANSDADKAKVEQAIKQLSRGYQMVKLPEAALCLFDKVEVEQTLYLAGKHDDHEGHDHDEHKDHDDHKGHDHDEHKDHDDHKGHDHDEHKDHDDHKGHDHDEHKDHDDHKGHDHDEHKDHDDHKGHDHDEEGHADFDVTYKFRCSQPKLLDNVSVGFFDAFPAIEEIDAQWIGANGQGAKELTKNSPEFKFQ